MGERQINSPFIPFQVLNEVQRLADGTWELLMVRSLRDLSGLVLTKDALNQEETLQKQVVNANCTLRCGLWMRLHKS